MSNIFDVIVAGVGGMGSASLYTLARRGQRVLGLEQFELGHNRGSSHGETRVIRMAYFEGSHYVPLVQRAYTLWDDLSAAAGQSVIVRTGSLEMAEPGHDFVERSEGSCIDHGLAYEVLDGAAIMGRFPAFRVRPETRAIFQPDGGYVLSEDAIGAHARLAVSHGARLHTGERMLDFKTTSDGGVVVRTDRGRYSAAHLVLTTGPWMSRFVPGLVESLATYKQAVAWFRPQVPAISAPGAMPVFIHFSDRGEFYGFPQHGARGIKVGGPHFARVAIDPDEPGREPTAEQVAELCGFVARHIPSAAGTPSAVSGCIYTRTLDEHFVIDRLPDAPQVLVVSPCSGHGYKFAPAIGEIVGDLVMTGGTTANIQPFALARFAAVG